MAKQTKNVITLAECHKTLVNSAKADVMISIIFLVVMSVLFVPFIFLGLYLAKYLVILGIVFALCCLIAPAYWTYELILALRKFDRVKRGEFSIVKDTVSRLSPGEPVGKSTVDAIYFSTYGRFVPGKTTYDLTSVGDEYYLVVMDTKKESIQMAFHTLMYECKDVE